MIAAGGRPDEQELLALIDVEERRLTELRKAKRLARTELAALNYDLASARAAHPSAAEWWTFAMFAAVLLPIMVLSSTHFGITWDENVRQQNGERVWEFLRGRLDRSFFTIEEAGMYGGLFDVICVAIFKLLPLDLYVVRHAVGAVFGWIGILYCGRLTSRLFGPWSGLLAMVLLAISPRYFADSMNNPKDLPFAAASIAALYYIATTSPRWPYVSWPGALKIAVALACALNIRAGALLFLGYFLLLMAGFTMAERVAHWRRLVDTALRAAAVTVGTLLLGTIFWPWASAAPLTRPFEALLSFANFDQGPPGVLFLGRWLRSTDLPRYYAPWWLLISTPPVVIVGLAASIARSRKNPARRWAVCALWIVAALPVAMVVVNHSSIYDGIRHLLFVYPVLVVLAASGWAAWLLADRARWVRAAAAGLLAAGLANIVVFDVRSHPNQTVYFNELVGGPRGAFARYDLDYWGNCMFQELAWTAETARLSGRRIGISAASDPTHLVQMQVGRFPQSLYLAPEHPELSVRLNRGSAQSMTDLANRRDLVHAVRTPDGAMLCAVEPGPGFEERRPRLSFAGDRFPYPPIWR